MSIQLAKYLFLIMKKIIVITLLSLIAYHFGYAQSSIDKIKLDSYFDALDKHNKFMGSIAVSKNGTILYEKAVGYADVENKIKASTKTRYRVGSISKSFTAVLILKAVEENKITLNQKIETWFPKLDHADKITVSHLLRHRSGIHNFTSAPDYLTWNIQAKTEKEMIEIIAKGGSDFEPGTKASYSNSNYVLLSYILEKTFSKSYSEILVERITNPLELKDTYIAKKINTTNNESRSYNFLGSWDLATETDYSIPLGAGAVTSSPSDLTKFANALFNNVLLNAASLEYMKTLKDGYGAGLFQIPFYKKIGFGHNGSIDGFRANFAYFPESKLAIALTSNGTNYDNNEILIDVLSAFYDMPYHIPTFETYTVNPADLNQYLGTYTSDQIALKITITKKGNTLIGQGTGQPAFPMEAKAKHLFSIAEVKATIAFKPSEGTMLLSQGGGKILFKKGLP